MGLIGVTVFASLRSAARRTHHYLYHLYFAPKVLVKKTRHWVTFQVTCLAFDDHMTSKAALIGDDIKASFTLASFL